MTVFTEFICAGVALSLCLFLMQGFAVIHRLLRKSTILSALVVWAVMWLVSPLPSSRLWLVPVTLVVFGFLGWYCGGMQFKNALLFGAILSVERLLAFGAVTLLTQKLLSASSNYTPIWETVAFFAFVCLSASVAPRWRNSPVGLLRLVPAFLVEVVLCWEAAQNRNIGYGPSVSILCLGWLGYCGILLFSVRAKLDKAASEHLETQQKHHHFALQEEYYRQLQEKQAETRALWHDLHKYLRAAQVETATTQALQQLGAMLDSATKIVDVGNSVLNVILNEYAQTAHAAGIDLRLKVQVPEKLAVSVSGLYILIGNTMDNAIEACRELPADQRLIDLTLRTHNDVLFYKLTNPYTSERAKRIPDPMHGHGLQNVRRCVENYGGSINILTENSMFIITAHLNIDNRNIG